MRSTIAVPKYGVNVNTLEHLAAKTLNLNEIGVCSSNLDQVIAFDSYKQNRAPAVSSSSTAWPTIRSARVSSTLRCDGHTTFIGRP